MEKKIKAIIVQGTKPMETRQNALEARPMDIEIAIHMKLDGPNIIHIMEGNFVWYYEKDKVMAQEIAKSNGCNLFFDGYIP